MFEKVIVPVILFNLLTPGVLLYVTKDTRLAILFHALVFVAVYWSIAKLVGLHLVKADLIVPAILFILLNPGLISGQSGNNFTEILLRSIIFGIIFGFLRKQFPQVY